VQDAEKILTDRDILWSDEWIKSAKPHHDIILKFFDGKLKPGMKILDIGERNPLTARLEEWCGVNIDNTKEDLDCTLSLVGNYDIIICSHVIEHLFNPLLFLWHTKVVMNEDARLYIITPIKPYWITPARCHFHEMNDSNFKKLVSRAGLKIIDWQEYSVPIPFRFSLRNWLRRFYKEYSIVTLIK
jgi:hypothetical protein